MNKKVKLCLVGLDGNAHSILGAFRRQAKREGWTDDEIATILEEAKIKDYNHLISVILDHCE